MKEMKENKMKNKNLIRDNWKTQSRDKSGRFGSYKTVKDKLDDISNKIIDYKISERSYTLKDIEKAYMKGLNDGGSALLSPSRKWELYKRTICL